ncbi:hypothetical protein [Glycomyces sp. NPDC048151]|uniref:hypothetical protein n=1 Tax=Glycomyces sp. NPDC048151 TaxID=3364002 RepID=UPI00371747FE
MIQLQWFRRPTPTPYSSVGAMRRNALGILDEFPDFCHWQEQSASECSAYCHLSAGLERFRRTLRDGRWDESGLFESDEPEFIHLYEVAFPIGGELLAELAHVPHNPTGVRHKPSRSAERDDLDRYVNFYFKHRAENGRLYYQDHHSPRFFVDFYEGFDNIVWDSITKANGKTVDQFGIGRDGNWRVLGVPSLPGLARMVVDQCKELDRDLNDPGMRGAIEAHFDVASPVYEAA